MITSLFYTSLLSSLLVFWLVTLFIIKKEKIMVFLPFLFMGMAFAFQSSFIFYDVSEFLLWNILMWSQIVAILAVFIYFAKRREKIWD